MHISTSNLRNEGMDHLVSVHSESKEEQAVGEYQGKKTDIGHSYSGVSKDGDTLEISQLSTCSKEKLKQLYDSHEINRQQYDRYMARFTDNGNGVDE